MLEAYIARSLMLVGGSARLLSSLSLSGIDGWAVMAKIGLKDD